MLTLSPSRLFQGSAQVLREMGRCWCTSSLRWMRTMAVICMTLYQTSWVTWGFQLFSEGKKRVNKENTIVLNVLQIKNCFSSTTQICALNRLFQFHILWATCSHTSTSKEKSFKSIFFYFYSLSVQLFLLNLYSLELKLPFLTSAETNDEIFMSYSYSSSYRSTSQH